MSSRPARFFALQRPYPDNLSYHDIWRKVERNRSVAINMPDNNTVERAIRPVALGRKNHLFAGSDGGADRWAIVASLLATAKLSGVEPYAYLKDALQRMTDGHPMSRIDDLLPWNRNALTIAE